MGARYSGHPALCPCGAVFASLDVPIRSRRMGQPLAHLSEQGAIGIART
jgi:hypothetical protein